MIAKRIDHRGECQHPQTPVARRACRAAKIAAAGEEQTLPAGYAIEARYGNGMSRNRRRWHAEGPEGWSLESFGDSDAERIGLIAAARSHAADAPVRAAAKAVAEAEKIVRAAEADRIAALIAERGPLATPRQVDYIMSLLVRRARSGEEGGFMVGPTDRAGVAEMSRADASAYINSLNGSY